MSDFLEIQSLGVEETAELEAKIRRRIEDRIKEGLLSEKEIREIEEMRLRPIPDILDVQSVYEDHLFRGK
ncbi:MAG: hypothetical protein PHX45_10870 [Acidobacteriota bacterium]|nr:hypothetical protein [Acidobacteriota bacterium]